MTIDPAKLEARFWMKVHVTSDCWLWTGSRSHSGNGHGQFWFEGKTHPAHRVAYELRVGQIPAGMHVCHSCDQSACVRPDHLVLGNRYSRVSVEERFWQKVDKRGPDECWAWLGARDRKGYGLIGDNGRLVRAHRLAFTLLVGPIPERLVLDHLCRNSGCVNPRHLEPVTNRENVLRGIGLPAVNAAKTHCVHGHPFSGENLVRGSRGRRACRQCRDRIRRETQARHYRRSSARIEEARAARPQVHAAAPSPSDRFWSKVLRGTSDECWIWLAGRQNTGYGSFWFNGRTHSAHRMAYALTKGPIPEGLELDHLCGVRYCVNPAHLEVVTPEENRRRSLTPREAAA